MGKFAQSIIGTQEGGFLVLGADAEFDTKYLVTEPNLTQATSEQLHPLGTEYHRSGQVFRYIQADGAISGSHAVEFTGNPLGAGLGQRRVDNDDFAVVKLARATDAGYGPLICGVSLLALTDEQYSWIGVHGPQQVTVGGMIETGRTLRPATTAGELTNVLEGAAGGIAAVPIVGYTIGAASKAGPVAAYLLL